MKFGCLVGDVGVFFRLVQTGCQMLATTHHLVPRMSRPQTRLTMGEKPMPRFARTRRVTGRIA